GPQPRPRPQPVHRLLHDAVRPPERRDGRRARVEDRRLDHQRPAVRGDPDLQLVRVRRVGGARGPHAPGARAAPPVPERAAGRPRRPTHPLL
ncbi:MAG: hypothetical protein AVDCRST_MAG40-2516, partial [uncultured Gemmatimonadaceae bacterium]